MKKKKKDPPGILDWIVDFFVSPVKNAVAGIAAKFVKEASKANVEEAKTATTLPAVTGELRFASPPEGDDGLTPDEAIERAGKVRNKMEDAYTDGVSAITAVSIMSMGFCEEPLTYLLRSPRWNAWLSVAQKITEETADYSLMAPLRRWLGKHYTPFIPDPKTLAQIRVRGLTTNENYELWMSENGLAADFSAMLKDAAYVYPNVGMTLDLWRRGFIVDEDVDPWLTRLAMPSAVRDAVKQLKRPLYPIPDLIQMLVREAFIPAMVTPAPDTFTEYIKQYGYEKIDADRWWTAHWIRMDPRDAARYFLWYNNQPEEFEKWMVVADLHPGDREKLTTVSYTPPGVRELGYGYDMGVYDREDIVSARRRSGRSPEDAEKCADSLIAYRIFAETEAVRREWLHLVSMGRKTLEEFNAKLVDLKTSPAAIPLWLERAELETERRKKPSPEYEYRIITSSEALWAFRNDLRDEKWVRAQLKELDWTEDRISLAVERVQKEKEVPEKPPPEVKYRNLTLTQIRDLYRFKKIPAEELPTAFEGIGYSPETAAMLAEVMLTVQAEEAAKEEERLLEAQERSRDQQIKLLYTTLRDELRNLYVEGFRERAQMESNLLEMATPADIADAYLAEADLRAELDFKRDLVKLYRDAFMKVPLTDEQFVALLLSIPLREDITRMEYLKARVSKKGDLPLFLIVDEYEDVLEGARKLVGAWRAG